MAQSGKSSRAAPRKKTPSDEVLIASYNYRQGVASAVRLIGGILAAGVLLLCAEPVAHVLAGKDTHVDVKLSVSIAITLAATTTAAGLYGRHHKKRADRLDARNRQLSTKLRELGVSDDQIADLLA